MNLETGRSETMMKMVDDQIDAHDNRMMRVS